MGGRGSTRLHSPDPGCTHSESKRSAGWASHCCVVPPALGEQSRVNPAKAAGTGERESFDPDTQTLNTAFVKGALRLLLSNTAAKMQDSILPYGEAAPWECRDLPGLGVVTSGGGCSGPGPQTQALHSYEETASPGPTLPTTEQPTDLTGPATHPRPKAGVPGRLPPPSLPWPLLGACGGKARGCSSMTTKLGPLSSFTAGPALLSHIRLHFLHSEGPSSPQMGLAGGGCGTAHPGPASAATLACSNPGLSMSSWLSPMYEVTLDLFLHM